jgi:hypothetical protein
LIGKNAPAPKSTQKPYRQENILFYCPKKTGGNSKHEKAIKILSKTFKLNGNQNINIKKLKERRKITNKRTTTKSQKFTKSTEKSKPKHKIFNLTTNRKTVQIRSHNYSNQFRHHRIYINFPKTVFSQNCTHQYK